MPTASEDGTLLEFLRAQRYRRTKSLSVRPLSFLINKRLYTPILSRAARKPGKCPFTPRIFWPRPIWLKPIPLAILSQANKNILNRRATGPGRAFRFYTFTHPRPAKSGHMQRYPSWAQPTGRRRYGLGYPCSGAALFTARLYIC